MVEGCLSELPNENIANEDRMPWTTGSTSLSCQLHTRNNQEIQVHTQPPEYAYSGINLHSVHIKGMLDVRHAQTPLQRPQLDHTASYPSLSEHTSRKYHNKRVKSASTNMMNHPSLSQQLQSDWLRGRLSFLKAVPYVSQHMDDWKKHEIL